MYRVISSLIKNKIFQTSRAAGLWSSILDPLSDWAWQFTHTIESSAIPSSQTGLPVPIQGTIPSLHATGEVLKLPLRKSVSAYGRDDYGLYDYSYSSAKVSAGEPHTVTLAGGASVSADGVNVNSGSVVITGNNDDWDLNVNGTWPSFCLDGWFKWTSSVANSQLLGETDGTQYNSLHYYGGQLIFRVRNGGNTLNWFEYTWTPAADTWYRISVTYSGGVAGTGALFVNGIQVASLVNPSIKPANNNSDLKIGTGGWGAGAFNGWAKDLTLLKTSGSVPASFGYLPQDLFQYNPHEVLNLPLTGHLTDLSYGTAKGAPETAHVFALSSGASLDGDGVYFNGSASSVNVAASADHDIKSSLNNYVRFTMKKAAHASAYEYLINKGGSGNRWAFLVNNDNKIRFLAEDGSITVDLKDTDTYPTGQDNVVELLVSGSSWILKVNGAQKASATATCNPTPSGATYYGTYAGGGQNYTGWIKDVLHLRGTSTAPASTYSHALQDLRFANGSTEVAYTAPLRGLNPISGQYDAWVKEDLSSSADTELTAYIGNAAAEVATEITWPTGWKRLFYRSGFQRDLINGTLGTLIGGATVNSDGLSLDASDDAMTDASSADYVSAGQFGIIVAYKPTNATAGSQTLINRRVDGGNAWIVVLNGTDLSASLYVGGAEKWAVNATVAWSNDAVGTVQVYCDGGSVRLYYNGSLVFTDSTITDYLASLAAIVNYGRNGAVTNYANGRMLAAGIMNAAYLDADASAILDAALRTPASFQTIGTLQANS